MLPTEVECLISQAQRDGADALGALKEMERILALLPAPLPGVAHARNSLATAVWRVTSMQYSIGRLGRLNKGDAS